MATTKTRKTNTNKTTKTNTKKVAVNMVRKVQPGFVSHTELVSNNPVATKAWTEKVLGWKFTAPMPMPTGPYHMWDFGNNTGGGIRNNNATENPGTVPYVEVNDIKASWARAVKEGATPMMPPTEVPGGGWIAMVQAPGGCAIGFWGTK